MRILLLGMNGQVGWELARTLSPLGELVTTARRGRADRRVDTGDPARLHATLDEVKPDLIVNATAYTAVDRAETEPGLAMRLNGEVPGLLGRWAAAHGALVFHYSTDYVFDGRKDGPYVETDPACPINTYGRTKLAGDEALLDAGCDALILRVSWVYGLRGRNFLLTMRRLMAERDRLTVVDDQLGAPTWCRSIAQVTALMLAKLPRDAVARQALFGVYHFAPAGATSWHGFATAIRDALGLDCRVDPIPGSQYPTPAARPANSRLDTTRLATAFGLHPASWQTDLGLCLDDRAPG